MPMLFSVDYTAGQQEKQQEGQVKAEKKVAQVGGEMSTSAVVEKPAIVKPEIVVTHIDTPQPLKGVYMSACYASTPSLRAKMVKMIDDTELNAVVIDVKDYTGTIAYEPTDPKLTDTQGTGCRVKDMQAFVASLHEKGIYVIGLCIDSISPKGSGKGQDQPGRKSPNFKNSIVIGKVLRTRPHVSPGNSP